MSSSTQDDGAAESESNWDPFERHRRGGPRTSTRSQHATEPAGTPSTAYDVLGVQRDASDAEVKKAYHQLAQIWHPDKNVDGSPEAVATATRRFAEISAAWEVLRDPRRRARYDAGLDLGLTTDPQSDEFGDVPIEPDDIVLAAVTQAAFDLTGGLEEGSVGLDAARLLVGASREGLREPSVVRRIHEKAAGDKLVRRNAGLANNAICWASDQLITDFVDHNPRALFVPRIRLLFDITESAVGMIRATYFPSGIPGYVDRPTPFADWVRRADPQEPSPSSKVTPPPPAPSRSADERPTPPCEVCGSGPTQSFSFSENRGYLFRREVRHLGGWLCRDCALTAGRDIQSSLLVRGWWGLISFFVTPFYALNNAFALQSAGKMRAPEAGPTSKCPPATPGPPVTRRPLPMTVLAAVALLVTVIAVNAVTNQPDKTTARRSGTSGSGLTFTHSSSTTTSSVYSSYDPASRYTPSTRFYVPPSSSYYSPPSSPYYVPPSSAAPSWESGACVSGGSGLVHPVPCDGREGGKIVGNAFGPDMCPLNSDSYVEDGAKVWCISTR